MADQKQRIEQLENLAKTIAKESTYVVDDYYSRCCHCHAIRDGQYVTVEPHKDDCPTLIAQRLLKIKEVK